MLMLIDDEEVGLNTELIDDNFQNGIDFDSDYLTEDGSSDSSESDDANAIQLKKSRFVGDVNKARFFSRECEMYEFSRTPVRFKSHKDNNDYHGIVAKALDKTHFIFLLDDEFGNPKKKMKKIDISDISVYF